VHTTTVICSAIYIIKYTDKWYEDVVMVIGVAEELKTAGTATGWRGHWGRHLLMGTDHHGQTVSLPGVFPLFI
jgi:hypothetical protein